MLSDEVSDIVSGTAFNSDFTRQVMQKTFEFKDYIVYRAIFSLTKFYHCSFLFLNTYFNNDRIR